MLATAAASLREGRRSVECEASVSGLGAVGSREASARSAGWKSTADATLAMVASAVVARIVNFMFALVSRSIVEYLLAAWCAGSVNWIVIEWG